MTDVADRRHPAVDRHCIVQVRLPGLDTPSLERVRWAAAVSALVAVDPNAGMLILDDKMLDRPHLKLAERTLTSAPLG